MRFLWQFFHRIVERIKRWRIERRAPRPYLIPLDMSAGMYPTSVAIHRDVTPNGVRVYSLCASCGARLHASATLCEECAQKKSRPARPY
jgi:ribosomal protein L40E